MPTMKDLTKGYPAKVIILFALPLLLGNIFQQLYNITDSKIVSALVSSDALAAVGATAVLSNAIIGFINGMTQGTAILIAKSFGAKDDKSLRNYMAGTIIITIIMAIVLTLLSELTIAPLLTLLRTPTRIYASALAYVRIILMGIPFISLYNMCANSLRAVGDSKSPLICLIISVVLNIGLDFLLVTFMGITGAAFATIIAQGISGIGCLLFLLIKYHVILPRKGEWRLSKVQYSNLLPSGFSMALMGSIVSLGTIFLQSAINDLGPEYVTAHTAGRRVFDIMMILIYTFGASMTTYVSQNYGAGEGARIRQGIRHAILIDTCITTVLVAFTFLAGKPVVSWIASTSDTTIVDAGVLYIRVGILFFYVLGPLFILRCSLQGLGHKIVPLISSGLELSIKILSSLFLVPALGYLGVALTEPISWVIMIIPLIILYLAKRPAA